MPCTRASRAEPRHRRRARREASAWRAFLRRTVREFADDELPDRAAALTYYGVLGLFPALLVLVSLLGLTGGGAAGSLLDDLPQLVPASARDVVQSALDQLRASSGTGSVLAVAGLLVALWSASGYVGAFIRSANAVYDLTEERPFWRLTRLRLVLTLVLMALAGTGAVIVVFTGTLARRAGAALGAGDTAVTVWSIAKWPVLALLVTFMTALLYWAAPDAGDRAFKWVTPGSLLALLIWLAASAGFAVYAAHFGSYNKTYGTLAGVIVFLVWLWITNLAILLGLELDAERERAARRYATQPDADRDPPGHDLSPDPAAPAAGVLPGARRDDGG